MWTNIRYILMTAVRDRLFAGLFLGLIAASLISSAMGQTALLEPQPMTLSFIGASSRMILAIGMIVFVCFHVRHAFESKEIDVLLSRPISRARVVLSYWMGFALIGLFLVLPVIVIFYLAGLIDINGFWIWTASLLMEIWLVVAIALFASFTLSSAVSSVLASLGFYVLSRMMGFFTATAKSGMLFSDHSVNEILRMAIRGVSTVIPRLDFFAKTDWLIYGVEETSQITLFLLQGGIFIPLLIVAAMIDFKRKQF